MTKTTYSFYESGAIPGIARDAGGEGHAGLTVEVEDGMVVTSYLRDEVTAETHHDNEAPILPAQDLPSIEEELLASGDYTTQPLVEEPVSQEHQSAPLETSEQPVSPPIQPQEGA